MVQPKVWTETACLQDALRFQTKMEWRRNSQYALKAAKALGVFDRCCAHMQKPVRGKPPRLWTVTKCAASAAAFTSRAAWSRHDRKAYSAASVHGWLDVCCAHMPPSAHKHKRGSWTEEKVMASAGNYPNPTTWYTEDSPAYYAAMRLGVLDKATAHMTYKVPKTDADVVYLLCICEDEHVYKIGITSARLGRKRVTQIAISLKKRPRIALWVATAHALEREHRALQVGKWVDLGSFEGKTEVRQLTQPELKQVINILKGQK